MTAHTLPQLPAQRAASTPHAVALREKDRGIWREITWAQYFERVGRFSLGLRALGIQPGDKVAIIGDNRPEWYIAELAAQAAGAASVGLFQDAVAPEVQAIVHHSDARIVVVEDQEQVDKLLEILADLPHVEHVVFWDPKGMRHYSHPQLREFAEIESIGEDDATQLPKAFDSRLSEGDADDLAVLCYTSGTTGDAKGAMLSHANLVAGVRNLTAIDPIQPGDNYLSFLPCGWVAEQTLGVTASVVTGLVVNFPEEPETVQHDMREIGPHLLMAAPRIWENLGSQVTVKMQDADWLKRAIYRWAMHVGHASLDGGRRSL
jgi:long-chain acyl-CoA synthetase